MSEFETTERTAIEAGDEALSVEDKSARVGDAFVRPEDRSVRAGDEAVREGVPAAPAGVEATLKSQPKTTLDIREIMAILPHRYPLLLIDRVIEIEPRQRIVALKNVTINEPHFAGHFPDYPIMPGVLMVEAIAQTGGALLLTEIEDRDQKLMVFTGIEAARFRRPVTPGDQLRIEVTVLNWRTRAVKMAGVITVEGKVVCDATVTCQVVPRMPKPAAAGAENAG